MRGKRASPALTLGKNLGLGTAGVALSPLPRFLVPRSCMALAAVPVPGGKTPHDSVAGGRDLSPAAAALPRAASPRSEGLAQSFVCGERVARCF